MIASRRSFFRMAAAGTVAATAVSTKSTLAVADAASGMTSELIRLNSNENAYGPSPYAVAAMREALLIANRYPQAACADLREEIARLHSVNHEQVVLGCGST